MTRSAPVSSTASRSFVVDVDHRAMVEDQMRLGFDPVRLRLFLGDGFELGAKLLGIVALRARRVGRDRDIGDGRVMSASLCSGHLKRAPYAVQMTEVDRRHDAIELTPPLFPFSKPDTLPLRRKTSGRVSSRCGARTSCVASIPTRRPPSIRYVDGGKCSVHRPLRPDKPARRTDADAIDAERRRLPLPACGSPHSYLTRIKDRPSLKPEDGREGGHP